MGITLLFIRFIFCILIGAVLARTTKRKISTSSAEVLQRSRQGLLEGQPGSWSGWSSWSTCSRSCGGGVAVQDRECTNKPMGRHRLRTYPVEAQYHCIGLYKRIHICNTKPCPGTTDFRQEQCSRYDNQLFLGQAYSWEPFMDGPNQCELNCRARGFRFYATLNGTVEDGTPCRGYIRGHDTDRWVCLAGLCKHVGCDGLVGSGQRHDSCGVCGGDNTSCRLVSGLFTRPRMTVGYYLIARIPREAFNLSVTELSRTTNFLALRKEDGRFILNGNWAINQSGQFAALGTQFSYCRHDEGRTESITAAGPLAEPVDLMIIYQQPIPVVRYQYRLPGARAGDFQTSTKSRNGLQLDSPATSKKNPTKGSLENTRLTKKPSSVGHKDLGSELRVSATLEGSTTKPRKKRRKFIWKTTGYSKCSRTCGGGVQKAVVECVRLRRISQLTVSEKRCLSLARPTPLSIRCNLKPCVANTKDRQCGVLGMISEC